MGVLRLNRFDWLAWGGETNQRARENAATLRLETGPHLGVSLGTGAVLWPKG